MREAVGCKGRRDLLKDRKGALRALLHRPERFIESKKGSHGMDERATALQHMGETATERATPEAKRYTEREKG